MDEDKIKQIAQQVYNDNQSKNMSGGFKVPKHSHNGVDSTALSQDNIKAGTYSTCGLKSVASETFTIETFPNVSNISLYGISADGLGRKASINGAAYIGNCFEYGNQGGGSVNYVKLVGGQYSNIIQTSSSVYFDTTGGGTATVLTGVTTNTSNFLVPPAGSGFYAPAVVSLNSNSSIISTGAMTVKVNASGNIGNGQQAYIIYVFDGTNVVAQMQIISWTETTITFQTTLATNWYVTFFLAMS